MSLGTCLERLVFLVPFPVQVSAFPGTVGHATFAFQDGPTAALLVLPRKVMRLAATSA